MLKVDLNETLVDAVIRSTHAGLQMAGLSPKPVGLSTIAARSQEVAVVIGLVGKRNGTVTLNLSRRAILMLANRFTDTDHPEVNAEVFDAVGEITNIVAGRLKGELSDPQFGVTSISCPSIIVGADYHLYHFRGFQTVSVEFELEEVPIIFWRDRLFSTTVSLGRA